MGHFSFSHFIVHVSKFLNIKLTQPLCLPFRIHANKIDAKSLRVLILGGLYISLELLFLTIFINIS